MNFYDYEIGLEETDTKDFYYDVLFCAFYRTPIIKQASYTILRINLSPKAIFKVQKDLSDNKHTKFKIIIYIVDRSDKYKRIKKIFYKNYLALNIKLKENFQPNKERVMCELLLVNPVLFYMNNTNTYNKILLDLTAYSALKQYESFIKSTYGDTFYFNHLGNVNNNSYKYEQILIKVTDDLNVPNQIINTFKTSDSFSYYFFDDFQLSEECDRDISCTCLNFSKKDQFAQFDITDFGDILQNVALKIQTKFNDDVFSLDKKEDSINYNHQEIIYKITKRQKSKVPEQKKITQENMKLNFGSDIDLDRKFVYTKSQESIKQLSQSSQTTNMYSPDSVSNAKKRFKEGKTFLTKSINELVTMESNNSFFEWLQFGKLYNFEINKPTEFLYTPLNIIHIFQRKIMKEHYLSHLLKFNCIKYNE